MNESVKQKLYLLSIKGTKNLSGKSFNGILKRNILLGFIFPVADIGSFLVLDLGREPSRALVLADLHDLFPLHMLRH